MSAFNKKLNARSSGGPDPASGIIAINYGAGNQVLAEDGRGLLITTAGNLNINCPDGTTGIITLAVGTYWIQVRQINQASSTAAGWILK